MSAGNIFLSFWLPFVRDSLDPAPWIRHFANALALRELFLSQYESLHTARCSRDQKGVFWVDKFENQQSNERPLILCRSSRQARARGMCLRGEPSPLGPSGPTTRHNGVCSGGQIGICLTQSFSVSGQQCFDLSRLRRKRSLHSRY